jgi:hypothetical protein
MRASNADGYERWMPGSVVLLLDERLVAGVKPSAAVKALQKKLL